VIAIALLLAQTAPEPGAFTHGPWQGRCYRDGYMAGMDHELCRATLTGPVTVTFERDATSMVFRATAEGCDPLTLNMDPPPATLAPEKFAKTMAVMLQLSLKSSMGSCKAKAPKIDVAPLSAIIAETSGLATRN
jgi:hypothetical protein